MTSLFFILAFLIVPFSTTHAEGMKLWELKKQNQYLAEKIAYLEKTLEVLKAKENALKGALSPFQESLNALSSFDPQNHIKNAKKQFKQIVIMGVSGKKRSLHSFAPQDNPPIPNPQNSREERHNNAIRGFKSQRLTGRVVDILGDGFEEKTSDDQFKRVAFLDYLEKRSSDITVNVSTQTLQVSHDLDAEGCITIKKTSYSDYSCSQEQKKACYLEKQCYQEGVKSTKILLCVGDCSGNQETYCYSMGTSSTQNSSTIRTTKSSATQDV